MGFSDFLEAAGRSDLPNITQGVVSNALKMKAMDNMDARYADEKRIRDLQYNEMKQAQEALDRPFNLTTLPAFKSLPPNLQADAMEFYKANNLVDANGNGTERSLRTGMRMIESDEALGKHFMGGVVKAKEDALITVRDKMNRALLAGDQKAATALKGEYDNAAMEYNRANGTFGQWLKIQEDKAEKAPASRVVERGGNNVTEEYQGNGQWKVIGTSPKWKGTAGGGGGTGRGGGRMTDFEREYQDYLDYVAQNDPEKRPMTRGEYKDSQNFNRARRKEDLKNGVYAKDAARPGYYNDNGTIWHYDGNRWKYQDSRSKTGWSYGAPKR